MAASAPMTSILRSSRSAHTPASTETMACGTNPHTSAAMSTTPDCVVRVRCQRIAYCTSDEPNIDTVCPARNTVALRTQRS